jgi:hypothetical protein
MSFFKRVRQRFAKSPDFGLCETVGLTVLAATALAVSGWGLASAIQASVDSTWLRVNAAGALVASVGLTYSILAGPFPNLARVYSWIEGTAIALFGVILVLIITVDLMDRPKEGAVTGASTLLAVAAPVIAVLYAKRAQRGEHSDSGRESKERTSDHLINQEQRQPDNKVRK